jgi:hypothetical protein
MSHSKFTKRGSSFYIDGWFPPAKKYVNICSICGAQGYSPVIDDDGFSADIGMRAIMELKKMYKPLAVDSLGRCEHCAELMDKK